MNSMIELLVEQKFAGQICEELRGKGVTCEAPPESRDLVTTGIVVLAVAANIVTLTNGIMDLQDRFGKKQLRNLDGEKIDVDLSSEDQVKRFVE